MGAFRWISTNTIPENLDLRRHGWTLASEHDDDEDGIVMVHTSGVADGEWMRLRHTTWYEARLRMLVSGVNDAAERTVLLAEGFGEVVGDETSLEELEARARRVANFARWVPRRRQIATLELDLLCREATYAGKPLNLHPREFDLLWRLADTPDNPVSKETLIRQVWRLDFAPESNSIAVHMARLRRKLELAGLAGLVETGSAGYRLRTAMLATNEPSSWRPGH